MSDIPTQSETKARWTKLAAELLVGRTIKRVRYMDADEVEASMWNSAAVVLELDNGIAIWPSRDDEGNDAGALFTTDDDLGTIPVI